MPVYTPKYIFYFILILYLNTTGCPLLKNTPSTLTRAINTLLYLPGWLIVHSCLSMSLKVQTHTIMIILPYLTKKQSEMDLFKYGMSFSGHAVPFVRVYTPDLSVPDMNIRPLD
jgi:hypothetical protein